MAELLVRAIADDTFMKGHITQVMETPHEWGAREGLPNYVHVTISDATKAQVEQYMNDWQIRYNYSIMNQNATRYRVKAEVDSVYIDASGLAKDQIKQGMIDYIEGAEPGSLWEGCTVVSWASDALTVDIPKPADLQSFRDDFNDKFADVLSITRYYFPEANVDDAVSQGGKVTITRTQALNIIVDKLEL